MKQYDLAVCGSGPSGVAASLAAARHGLSVILIDDDPEIGGTPVDCYVQSYCGDPYTAIRREIHERMMSFNPEVGNNCGFRRATYLLAIRSLLAESGVEICTGRFIDRSVPLPDFGQVSESDFLRQMYQYDARRERQRPCHADLLHDGTGGRYGGILGDPFGGLP